MSFMTTVFLGALAGFTIYLGLPFARIKNPSRSLQAFLNSLATGILVFLLLRVACGNSGCKVVRDYEQRLLEQTQD